ncbi:MAG: hypothetical protein HN849_30040, partial [Victivallales bacterium]|nr:hypothetical protein [Victivallales bacterium]
AVSSQERPVTAKISGLPEGISGLRVHCEKRKAGDEITVTEGAIDDVFPWLTVHLYSAELP